MELALGLVLMVAAFKGGIALLGRLARVGLALAGTALFMSWLTDRVTASWLPWALGLGTVFALLAWYDLRTCRQREALGLPPLPGTITHCAQQHRRR